VKKIFLAILAETNCLKTACRRSGISRDTAWKWRVKGFITEQELLEARALYEDVVETALWEQWCVKHGRVAEIVDDPFQDISSRSLLARAKRVLPEYGGVPFGELHFTTNGWSIQEIQEVRKHIIEIQSRHKQSEIPH
jgi:hypothetical protein